LLRRRRQGNEKPVFGVVTLPRAVPRLLRLPAANGGNHFVFLRDIVADNAEKLYRGYEILASTPFRVIRNSNLHLEEEETRTLLAAVSAQRLVLKAMRGEAA
jgi:polyphosphate kinase